MNKYIEGFDLYNNYLKARQPLIDKALEIVEAKIEIEKSLCIDKWHDTCAIEDCAVVGIEYFNTGDIIQFTEQSHYGGDASYYRIKVLYFINDNWQEIYRQELIDKKINHEKTVKEERRKKYLELKKEFGDK